MGVIVRGREKARSCFFSLPLVKGNVCFSSLVCNIKKLILRILKVFFNKLKNGDPAKLITFQVKSKH